MHECPECGSACSCDIDDMWWEDVDECDHRCPREPDEDFDDESMDDGPLEDDCCESCGGLLAPDDIDLCEDCEDEHSH